jgi:type 1 glutamine amidotransferase
VFTGSNNGLAFVAEVVQLKAIHGLLPPEFRKRKSYKITIRKNYARRPTYYGISYGLALFRIRSSLTKWTGLSFPF